MRRTDSIRPPSRLAERFLLSAGLLAALIAGLATTAGAIPVGASAGPGATTPIVFDEQDYGVWFVADLSDPVTAAPIFVTPTAGAGAWTFELGFATDAIALQTGDQFVLQELVQLEAGDFAVGRWAQEILSPDWRWIDAAIFDNGTSFPLEDVAVDLTNVLVTLSFAPLPAGAKVLVVKLLEYVGPGVDVSSGGLEVATSVYIPEPATATLLLVGVVIASLHKVGGSVGHG